MIDQNNPTQQQADIFIAFKYLDWNQRRALCFLYQVSKPDGIVESPYFLQTIPDKLASALGCHEATAYKILNQLQGLGFLDLLRLPSSHPNTRKHLMAVRLHFRDYYRLAKIRDILLFHPDCENWLGGASHYRVKEKEGESSATSKAIERVDLEHAS